MKEKNGVGDQVTPATGEDRLAELEKRVAALEERAQEQPAHKSMTLRLELDASELVEAIHRSLATHGTSATDSSLSRD